MSVLWLALQVTVIATVGVAFLNLVGNMRLLRQLGNLGRPKSHPFVSILVPARNEEANIAACLRSLLAQDYPDYEIVALDDNSSDLTGHILTHMAARDGRLRVLAGRPLPPGWVGKNWACHQLAQAARGDLLLFTDADTRHHPQALSDAVAALLAEDADLLTVFPQQEVVSLSEQLLVPVLTWCFVLFLPLGLAYRSRRPELSIAIGQYMLFQRRAFEEIGGYAAVGHELVDDLALVRAVKAHGLRWRLMDGSTRLRCRMYHGFRDVFHGFNKNIFPGFPGAVWTFVLTLAVAAVLLLQPPAVLLLHLAGVPMPEVSLALAAVAVSMSLLLIGISYPRFDFPSYLMFLYPVTALATIAISLSSLGLALLGQYTWKGRRLLRHKIRWW